MQRTPFHEMTCPIARTLAIVGEWWTPLILRDISLGLTRFDRIQRNLGISRKVLTERLNALVDHGVVERVPYQDNPPRYDYRLTEKGRELGLVLLALRTWGDRWAFDEAPVQLRHLACGEVTTLVPTCSCCGERLTPRNVVPVVAEGARFGPGTTELPAGIASLYAGLSPNQ